MEKSFKLPPMEHRFSINVQGEESQVNYMGDFLYKRPTIGEKSLIDQMRARLNGDLRTIDDNVALNNEALSYLRFTLKEFPDFWKESQFGFNLVDENVLLEIYNKVVQFEADWRKKVYGEPKGVEVGEDKASQSF
jgi:hypothetical protein